MLQNLAAVIVCLWLRLDVVCIGLYSLQVELDDLLPAASVMVVTVTATTTSGKPLSEELLAKVQQGCDMALQLDTDKQQVCVEGGTRGWGVGFEDQGLEFGVWGPGIGLRVKGSCSALVEVFGKLRVGPACMEEQQGRCCCVSCQVM